MKERENELEKTARRRGEDKTRTIHDHPSFPPIPSIFESPYPRIPPKAWKPNVD